MILTYKEFREHLDKFPDIYEYKDTGVGALWIHNKRFDTTFEVSQEAIELTDVTVIENILKGGKDVEHITRVTGYFAKVSGWNDGKKQELKDRSKSTVE